MNFLPRLVQWISCPIFENWKKSFSLLPRLWLTLKLDETFSAVRTLLILTLIYLHSISNRWALETRKLEMRSMLNQLKVYGTESDYNIQVWCGNGCSKISISRWVVQSKSVSTSFVKETVFTDSKSVDLYFLDVCEKYIFQQGGDLGRSHVHNM